MDAVNLLPVDYRDRKRKRTTPADNLDGRQTLRIGGGVAASSSCSSAGSSIGSTVRCKQPEGAREQQGADRCGAAAGRRHPGRAGGGRGTASVAQSLTGTRMNWDRALNDFARVLPTNSFLTSIAMTAPVTAASAAAAADCGRNAGDVDRRDHDGGPPAAAPTVSTLTLAGAAPSTPGVAAVMDRLSLLPWLSDVALDVGGAAGQRVEHLQLSANVSEAK